MLCAMESNLLPPFEYQHVRLKEQYKYKNNNPYTQINLLTM